jgi:hypothetical protein
MQRLLRWWMVALGPAVSGKPVPPSQDLLTAAAALNAWEAPQLGRAWQLMLLRTGSLTFNGERHPYGTVAIDHDRYELRPRDPALPRFITTGAGKG